jgi:hypothetical protein
MIKLAAASLSRSVAVYGFLLLFPAVSRSQNVTLNWPDPQQAQPSEQSAPQKSGVTGRANPPVGGRPTDGSISRKFYTNNFFHFSLPIPGGWKVLGNDVDLGDKAAKGDVLLLMGTVDRQTHGTRWISISAINLPSGSGSITAEDYLKRIAYAFKLGSSKHIEKGSTPWLPTGEPTEISVGGRRMARLDMTGQVNGISARWSQIAIVERGYLMLFQFYDPVEDAPGIQAAQSINSLHFFAKSN